MAAIDDTAYVHSDDNDPETEFAISLTGLTTEDLKQPLEEWSLQQLIKNLPQNSIVQNVAANFAIVTTHIRQQLSADASDLDLATDTHLASLKNTLTVILQTYIRHPDDDELTRANAVQTIQQVQRSMKALQQ